MPAEIPTLSTAGEIRSRACRSTQGLDHKENTLQIRESLCNTTCTSSSCLVTSISSKVNLGIEVYVP
jgi:hypothetical protein